MTKLAHVTVEQEPRTQPPLGLLPWFFVQHSGPHPPGTISPQGLMSTFGRFSAPKNHGQGPAQRVLRTTRPFSRIPRLKGHAEPRHRGLHAMAGAREQAAGHAAGADQPAPTVGVETASTNRGRGQSNRARGRIVSLFSHSTVLGELLGTAFARTCEHLPCPFVSCQPGPQGFWPLGSAFVRH